MVNPILTYIRDLPVILMGSLCPTVIGIVDGFRVALPILRSGYLLSVEGSRYFCEIFFRASCSKNQQKITRPPMPSAAPIRPRHLVSTQQGVET